MNSRIPVRLSAPAGLTLGLLLAGCGPEPIEVYEVPREQPVAVAESGVDGVSWRIPETWEARDPGNMRLAEFLTPDGALLSVARLPAGTPLLQNVNRWRRQLGLEPIAADALPEYVTRTELNERPFTLIDLANGERRFRIAQHENGGSAWFFKLEGPDEATTASFDELSTFLTTLSFEASPMDPALAAVPGAPGPGTDMDPADPEKGRMQALPGMSTQVAAMGEAAWTAPDHWHAEDPGMIRKGSWHIHGPGNATADMAVTAFPNDVGGVLANVNRWRTQIGLPEVNDPATDASWQERTVDGYPTRVVRLIGPGGQSTLVAMVSVDAGLWFFKLTGDSALVDSESESFHEFLDTVSLPAGA